VPAQHGCHVSRSLAAAISQLEQAEPEGDEAQDGVRVVAALVAPLLVGGMGRSAV